MMVRSFIFILLFPITLYSQNYLIDTLLTGMNQPIDFALIPNSSKVLITHKYTGASVYDVNIHTYISDFWNFTDTLTACSERGVLGICIDPNYVSNHYVYIYYVHSNPPNTNTNLKFRIVRLTENNNIGTNPFIVFEHPDPSTSCFHVGGYIRIRPSEPDKIYLQIGARTFADAQTVSNPRGKVLRVNTNGTIPTDNPFYDDGNPFTGNDDRIWAYGFRNGFGICFGPNDSMYETDNGEMNYDEVNFVSKGKNYGAAFCEGYCNPYNPLYRNPMGQFGLPQPVFRLPALTGLLVYTGNQMPWLAGKLLLASNNANTESYIYQCILNTSKDSIISSSMMIDMKQLTTLAQGTDGYIYTLNGGYTANGKLFRIKPDLTGISNNNIPVGYSLSQNYPNPFNPVTSIKYEILKAGFVTLKIFNALGMELTTIVNETKQQGSYEVMWDASKYPSGVYFYELTSGEFSERKKMVLIK